MITFLRTYRTQLLIPGNIHGKCDNSLQLWFSPCTDQFITTIWWLLNKYIYAAGQISTPLHP